MIHRLVAHLPMALLWSAIFLCALFVRNPLPSVRWIRRAARDIARWIRLARRGHPVRYRVRRPIRSTRNDAKRAARQFASNYAGRQLSWKAARKLLKRLERKLAVTT